MCLTTRTMEAKSAKKDEDTSNHVSISRHSVRFADARSSEPKAVSEVSKNRVAQLKATLRSSFSADESMRRSWNAKSFRRGGDDDDDDLSMSSSDDEDEFSSSNGLDKSEHFRARAQREMDQSQSFNVSFWKIGQDVPEDLQGKNKMTGTTKNGVSRKRIADLKSILKGAILDSSSSSSNTDLMSKSCPATTTGSRRVNDLLNVMVNASQKHMIQKQGQRRTGRGSIFVINDEKFGNTKVVQKRLEKAADKIQRFIRRALFVLKRYNQNRLYLQRELQDTERRRREELVDVRQWVRDETERFRMQMEREQNDGKREDQDDIAFTQDDWESFDVTQQYLRQQIAEMKADNQTLQKETKELEHEYETNKLEADSLEREAENARLEKEVEKQTKDMDDWKRLESHYRGALDEATEQLEVLAAKRIAKRKERKTIEKVIRKIIELTRKQQGEANPKLVEKITKLKARRDKKVQKLKEQTAQGLLIPSSTEVAEDEERETPKRRESTRKSKKTVVDDLPDLQEITKPKRPEQSPTRVEAKDQAVTALESIVKEGKKKKKDKKQKKDGKKPDADFNWDDGERDVVRPLVQVVKPLSLQTMPTETSRSSALFALITGME